MQFDWEQKRLSRRQLLARGGALAAGSTIALSSGLMTATPAGATVREQFYLSVRDLKVAIAIAGGNPVPGAAIELMVKAFTIGAQPPTPAQLQKARAELWLAEPGPIEHSFFIAAAGNPKLVIAVTIDAAHPTPAPGSPLQLSPRKPTATPAELASAKSQLWTYSQAITGPFPGVGATLPGEGGVFIESELGNDLVIAIAGVQAVPGIPLQLERRMSTATASEIQAAKGQLWDGIST